MADQKDVWDILALLTPLIIGGLITGIGALFTHIYNFRQLQLNQIQALEKLHPMLVSEKPEDREFAYASFAALGYEETAIRIIEVKRDPSGRELLEQLTESGHGAVKAHAKKALHTLDEASRLINKLEGEDSEFEIEPLMGSGASLAKEFGLTTKLGISLVADTAVHQGPPRARKVAQEVSERLGGTPADGVSEREWVKAYLAQRKTLLQDMAQRTNVLALAERMEEFDRLVALDDWDLREYADADHSSRSQ